MQSYLHRLMLLRFLKKRFTYSQLPVFHIFIWNIGFQSTKHIFLFILTTFFNEKQKKSQNLIVKIKRKKMKEKKISAFGTRTRAPCPHGRAIVRIPLRQRILMCVSSHLTFLNDKWIILFLFLTFEIQNTNNWLASAVILRICRRKKNVKIRIDPK